MSTTTYDATKNQCYHFFYSCDYGWNGDLCDSCETLPGCKHGSCAADQPLTCQCEPGWIGPFCDCPKCTDGCDFDHGYCTKPNECLCAPGWSGPNCDQCITHPGCPKEGTCLDEWDCFCADNIEKNAYCEVKNRSIGGEVHIKSLFGQNECYQYNVLGYHGSNIVRNEKNLSISIFDQAKDSHKNKNRDKTDDNVHNKEFNGSKALVTKNTHDNVENEKLQTTEDFKINGNKDDINKDETTNKQSNVPKGDGYEKGGKNELVQSSEKSPLIESTNKIKAKKDENLNGSPNNDEDFKVNGKEGNIDEDDEDDGANVKTDSAVDELNDPKLSNESNDIDSVQNKDKSDIPGSSSKINHDHNNSANKLSEDQSDPEQEFEENTKDSNVKDKGQYDAERDVNNQIDDSVNPLKVGINEKQENHAVLDTYTDQDSNSEEIVYDYQTYDEMNDISTGSSDYVTIPVSNNDQTSTTTEYYDYDSTTLFSTSSTLTASSTLLPASNVDPPNNSNFNKIENKTNELDNSTNENLAKDKFDAIADRNANGELNNDNLNKEGDHDQTKYNDADEKNNKANENISKNEEDNQKENDSDIESGKNNNYEDQNDKTSNDAITGTESKNNFSKSDSEISNHHSESKTGYDDSLPNSSEDSINGEHKQETKEDHNQNGNKATEINDNIAREKLSTSTVQSKLLYNETNEKGKDKNKFESKNEDLKDDDKKSESSADKNLHANLSKEKDGKKSNSQEKKGKSCY